MKNFFKAKLKDRLMYCLNWRKETQLYLMSKELNDNVNNRYYEKRPLSKFLMKIYFLPTDILKFFQHLRVLKNLEKNNIEIKYIYSQLEENENDKKNKLQNKNRSIT